MKLNENVKTAAEAQREPRPVTEKRRPRCGGRTRSETIVFDIETGPLPTSELAALLPPFDPADVKLGNLKDPEKIKTKLAEAEANYLGDCLEKAALDPLTGRVLAIGLIYIDDGEFVVIGGDDEALVLREFWDVTRGDMGRINEMIGFNSNAFDLPFLIRRSWRHRVEVPRGIRRGRYWSEQMIDVRDAWQLGDRHARGSLDRVARHLGVGSKNGSGADFAKLWISDPEKAIEYLRNDVELTLNVAEALGII